ncbi:hypothetical protein MTR_7g044675 [Medicago truncatula]|uniref:Uncharacterized protein n=1 Tax=Medicago truncatula TaxID=3880 RepID=A0A072TXX3_MEDTR|nr:hypothetical protein MTR_7g044675 [Medicago truncatula]
MVRQVFGSNLGIEKLKLGFCGEKWAIPELLFDSMFYLSEEWGKKMIEVLFYLAWRSFNSLPTYPFKGSKPNVVHSRKLFLFLLVDFKFEKGILKNGDERPQEHEI